MRDDVSLAAILQSVQAATPEPLPWTGLSLLAHPDPGVRRFMRLQVMNRQDTFDILADILATETATPDWIARMALDAVIPEGGEHELDHPAAHTPALLRAKVAMGFRPCRPA